MKFSIYISFVLLTFNCLGCEKSASSIPAEQNKRFTEYQQLFEKNALAFGPMGQVSKGEIEITLDLKKMKEIEDRSHHKIGVILDNPFWLILNDPVQFPSGKNGVYGRLLWKSSLGQNSNGVAVLIIKPDGHIVLNRNYRHATRSWEYEIPRGGTEKGELARDAAEREVKEETGFLLKDLKVLGEFANDSGMTNSKTTVFLAKVDRQTKSTPEYSEAIAAVESFSIEDIRKGLLNGYLISKSEKSKIPLRDPSLTFALWQAEARGFLSSLK